MWCLTQEATFRIAVLVTELSTDFFQPCAGNSRQAVVPGKASYPLSIRHLCIVGPKVDRALWVPCI